LLDKHTGVSSNKALQQVRRLFDAQKAGHTGSLDPLATGMLPICFGEATKLSQFLLNADKSYLAEIKLGETTDSADSDGDVLETKPVPQHLDIDSIDKICQTFSGPQMQVPPMVSAIKVNGQRLYKLAREGITVERQPRAVTLHHIEVMHYHDAVITLSVSCSKGTYIRSLATDIGAAIGCGGHIQMLRRTYVSPFEHHAMHSLEKLQGQASLDDLLLPIDVGLSHLASVTVKDAAQVAFRQGQRVPVDESSCENEDKIDVNALAEAPIRVYSEAGRLVGLGTFAEVGLIAPFKVIQWD
jgi:tRNA pseudouridine55 synthase